MSKENIGQAIELIRQELEEGAKKRRTEELRAMIEALEKLEDVSSPSGARVASAGPRSAPSHTFPGGPANV